MPCASPEFKGYRPCRRPLMFCNATCGSPETLRRAHDKPTETSPRQHTQTRSLGSSPARSHCDSAGPLTAAASGAWSPPLAAASRRRERQGEPRRANARRSPKKTNLGRGGACAGAQPDARAWPDARAAQRNPGHAGLQMPALPSPHSEHSSRWKSARPRALRQTISRQEWRRKPSQLNIVPHVRHEGAIYARQRPNPMQAHETKRKSLPNHAMVCDMNLAYMPRQRLEDIAETSFACRFRNARTAAQVSCPTCPKRRRNRAQQDLPAQRLNL